MISIKSTSFALQEKVQELTHLERDAIKLFLGEKHGHMGKWEYEPALYQGDPAGGADYWSETVHSPGYYYLPQADINLINWVIQQPILQNKFLGIKSIVELGPGSLDAINKKTLPFITACRNMDHYVAVDYAIDQALYAVKEIENRDECKVTVLCHDFMSGPVNNKSLSPCAFIMWGASLGNLLGNASDNPFNRLKHYLYQLSQNLKSDDCLILTFDTESNEEKILAAYNEHSMKAGLLSPLHLLYRDGIATGNFDPRVWCHEPVWFPDVMQCAHTIYPMFDQTIHIAGHIIKVPAWRRFISNNSYKFKPETVIRAAQEAGLTAEVIQYGSMAMLIAEK